jgi:tryptophanyl-tRNA synthetase
MTQAYKDQRLLYRELKDLVAQYLLQKLEPIQRRRRELSEEHIRRVLHRGADQARALAQETMSALRQRLGSGSFAT